MKMKISSLSELTVVRQLEVGEAIQVEDFIIPSAKGSKTHIVQNGWCIIGRIVGEKGTYPKDVKYFRQVDPLSLLKENKRLKQEVLNWTETAAQYACDVSFYRDLICKIGSYFGRAAKTSDDGSIQEEVLALKVPELVEKLRTENAHLRQLNLDVTRQMSQMSVITNLTDLIKYFDDRESGRVESAYNAGQQKVLTDRNNPA